MAGDTTQQPTRRKLTCGRMYSCVDDVRSFSEATVNDGFDFLTVCIGHPRCRFTAETLPDAVPPIGRPDVVMSAGEWNQHVAGTVSPWIDVDSSDEELRMKSEKALLEELRYANYLGLTVILVPLHSRRCWNLARVLADFLDEGTTTAIWLIVPASLTSSGPSVDVKSLPPGLGEADEDEDEDSTVEDSTVKAQQSSDTESNERRSPEPAMDDPWEWWNTVRMVCNSNRRLVLALRVPVDLPDNILQQRWQGEPVRAVLVDTGVFLTNNRGFPVLSRAHQRFLNGMFKLSVQVVLSGACLHENQTLYAYVNYFGWLHSQCNQQQNSGIGPTMQQIIAGYEDCLQVPLQPLCDNLESSIYEIFERDPFKYNQYQSAVVRALQERVNENPEGSTIVIMVVGAGRGPLVTASLRAAQHCKVAVKVYAVEKNQNAIVTLRHLAATEELWTQSSVEVIHADMRDWHPEHKADILVSELLGSFGDNELSPECLDGAQRLLKADGVSIPRDYTSFICPIMSQKLYTQIRDESTKPDHTREKVLDMAYVVRLQNYFAFDAPKPVFKFTHPNWERSSNERYARLDFSVPCNATLHGFAGYFDSTLYGDVMMSTVPDRHSPGMFSWFPILFPVREPLYVSAGNTVHLYMWRRQNAAKVWYEWCVEVRDGQKHTITATPLQNTGGKVYKMKLS